MSIPFEPKSAREHELEPRVSLPQTHPFYFTAGLVQMVGMMLWVEANTDKKVLPRRQQ